MLKRLISLFFTIIISITSIILLSNSVVALNFKNSPLDEVILINKDTNTLNLRQNVVNKSITLSSTDKKNSINNININLHPDPNSLSGFVINFNSKNNGSFLLHNSITFHESVNLNNPEQIQHIILNLNTLMGSLAIANLEKSTLQIEINQGHYFDALYFDNLKSVKINSTKSKIITNSLNIFEANLDFNNGDLHVNTGGSIDGTLINLDNLTFGCSSSFPACLVIESSDESATTKLSNINYLRVNGKILFQPGDGRTEISNVKNLEAWDIFMHYGNINNIKTLKVLYTINLAKERTISDITTLSAKELIMQSKAELANIKDLHVSQILNMEEGTIKGVLNLTTPKLEVKLKANLEDVKTLSIHNVNIEGELLLDNIENTNFKNVTVKHTIPNDRDNLLNEFTKYRDPNATARERKKIQDIFNILYDPSKSLEQKDVAKKYLTNLLDDELVDSNKDIIIKEQLKNDFDLAITDNTKVTNFIKQYLDFRHTAGPRVTIQGLLNLNKIQTLNIDKLTLAEKATVLLHEIKNATIQELVLTNDNTVEVVNSKLILKSMNLNTLNSLFLKNSSLELNAVTFTIKELKTEGENYFKGNYSKGTINTNLSIKEAIIDNLSLEDINLTLTTTPNLTEITYLSLMNNTTLTLNTEVKIGTLSIRGNNNSLNLNNTGTIKLDTLEVKNDAQLITNQALHINNLIIEKGIKSVLPKNLTTNNLILNYTNYIYSNTDPHVKESITLNNSILRVEHNNVKNLHITSNNSSMELGLQQLSLKSYKGKTNLSNPSSKLRIGINLEIDFNKKLFGKLLITNNFTLHDTNVYIKRVGIHPPVTQEIVIVEAGGEIKLVGDSSIVLYQDIEYQINSKLSANKKQLIINLQKTNVVLTNNTTSANPHHITDNTNLIQLSTHIQKLIDNKFWSPAMEEHLLLYKDDRKNLVNNTASLAPIPNNIRKKVNQQLINNLNEQIMNRGLNILTNVLGSSYEELTFYLPNQHNLALWSSSAYSNGSIKGGTINGNNLTNKNSTNTKLLNTKILSTTIGIDNIYNNAVLGGGLSYGNLTAKSKNFQSKLAGNSYSINIYLGYNTDYKLANFYTISNFSYTLINHKQRRQIKISTLNGIAVADISDKVFTLNNEFGSILDTEFITLNPYVGISYSYYTMNDYKENNHPLSLKVTKENINDVIGSIGLRLSKVFYLETTTGSAIKHNTSQNSQILSNSLEVNEHDIAPFLNLEYNRKLNKDISTTKVAFTHSYTKDALSLQDGVYNQNTLELQLGINYLYNGILNLAFLYSQELNQQVKTSTFQLNAKYFF